MTPQPAPTAAPIAETRPRDPPLSEPIAAEAPVIVAESPVIVAEPPVIVAESPVIASEPPVIAAEPPVIAAEAPIMAAQAPAPVDEAPADPVPAPAGGLTLRLETERGSRSTFQVTKTGATIGRGPESTIQLPDLSVSRKHARIAYKQGAYWLSDLGSMGGTWVDGTKLAAPRRVATGQTIDIGVCRLVVVAAAEGEKNGAAKGPSSTA
jgi:hypothetical protein